MKMHQFVSFNNFSLHLEYIFRSIWALVCKFNQWFTNHPGNACNKTWCWMSSSPNIIMIIACTIIINMLKEDLFPSRLQWTNFKNTYICTLIHNIYYAYRYTSYNMYGSLTSWNFMYCIVLLWTLSRILKA